MKFDEAKARLLKILAMREKGAELRSQFIADLLQDKELTVSEISDLLRLRSDKSVWPLGLFIVAYDDEDAVIKYLTLLERLLDQGIANEIIVACIEERFLGTTYVDLNFCYILGYKQKNPAIQCFFKLLKKLHERGSPLKNILTLLNNKINFIDRSNKPTSFFTYLAKDIDLSILVSLIKKHLAQFICFDDLHNNPKNFLEQLKKHWQQVHELMQLLDNRFLSDKELDLLSVVINIYDHLVKNKLTEFTFTGNFRITVILPLFSACLSQLECNREFKFKAVHFQCALVPTANIEDENATLKFVECLANVFKYVEIVTLSNCHINKNAMDLLLKAKQLAGRNYLVKQIELKQKVIADPQIVRELLAWVPDSPKFSKIIRYDKSKQCLVQTPAQKTPRPNELLIEGENDERTFIELNSTDKLERLDALNRTYAELRSYFPPNITIDVGMRGAYVDGLILDDPRIEQLEIRDTQIFSSMVESDAFLNFLEPLHGLKILILKNLSFADDATRDFNAQLN